MTRFMRHMTFACLRSMKPAFLILALAAGFYAQTHPAKAAGSEIAIVAGGCFWCVESDFEKVEGVIEVVSGFSGGTVENPTYKQVTRGGTGHLEVAQITFDPSVISYAKIVDLFLRSIDPFDAGGQFCDRGESYTTAIFAEGAEQTRIALAATAKAEAELGRKIVTPVREAAAFYPAPAYHQDFYKSSEIILTRFGPRTKAEAYKRYRASCGRDERVKEVWGGNAPFVGG